MKEAYPHQKVAAKYLVDGGFYLFMYPRTGKTLSCIIALEELKATEVLVVCPVSVQQVWFEELGERGLKATVITGTKRKKIQGLQEDGAHIVTFESSWRLPLDPSRYQVIIFDEALKLQNGRSKVGTFWRLLRKEKQLDHCRLWGLSGAPCPESALQLANQMFILWGSWFQRKEYEDYLWDFWEWEEASYKFVPKHWKHVDIAKNGFSSKAMRVSQEDLNMGEKIYETRRVQAGKPERHLWDIAQSKSDDTASALSGQLAGAGLLSADSSIEGKPAKLEAVIAATKDILENDPEAQVVIMHRFRATGQYLSNALNCDWFVGGTTQEFRARSLTRFKTGEQRVIVCQTEVAKMGIDLSMADTLIYAEHSWSGDTFIQSVQRTTNITRKRPALIITYCAVFGEDSIDEVIYESVRNKHDFNARMIR